MTLRRRFSPWIDCLVWLFTGWLIGFFVTVFLFKLEQQEVLRPELFSLLKVTPHLLGIGIVIWLGLSMGSDSPRTVLSIRKPPWRALPWVILSSLSLALLSTPLNTWIEQILPMPPQIEALYEELLEFDSAWQFLVGLIFLVIVAPVTEELMFRGLFLHRLGEGYGRWVGIAGSAVCFGIFHVLPWQAILAVPVGFYLGWLVMRTGSIFVPMIAHASFNLVPMIANVLSEAIPDVQLPDAEEPAQFSIGLLVLTTVTLAAGIVGTAHTAPKPPPDRRLEPGSSTGIPEQEP